MLLESLSKTFFRGRVGIAKMLGGPTLVALVAGSLLGGCLEAPLAIDEASSALDGCACGNGVLEAGEGCDDGNREGGDGCNASCLIEDHQPCNDECPGAEGDASCASGVCDTTGGQPGTCEPANVCGNGRLEAGEGCDDGNREGGDGCNANCLIEDRQPCNDECPGAEGDASCASGVCDTTGGQPGTCEPANVCGNGRLEAGEGCDDGNAVCSDGCDAHCLIEDDAACNTEAPGAMGNASCASGTCNPSGTCGGRPEDPDLSGLGISGGGCDAGAGGGSGATLLLLLALGTVWSRRRRLAPRSK